MSETKSQEEQILAYLQAGNQLTPIDALNLFGSFRLGARIYTLKKQGHKIETETITTPSGKRVAQYRMEEPTKPKGEKGKAADA